MPKEKPKTPEKAKPVGLLAEMEVEPKYSIGEHVSFSRNSIVNSPDVVIIATQPIVPALLGATVADPYAYLFEFEMGWAPSVFRIIKYGLDPNKKYIFAFERELTAI